VGSLEVCLVGAKPTKAPCGDGTGYQETSTYFKKTVFQKLKCQTMQNSSK